MVGRTEARVRCSYRSEASRKCSADSLFLIDQRWRQHSAAISARAGVAGRRPTDAPSRLDTHICGLSRFMPLMSKANFLVVKVVLAVVSVGNMLYQHLKKRFDIITTVTCTDVVPRLQAGRR